MKKSLACAMVAAQPVILSGLLRASGGGGSGSGTSTKPDTTTEDPYDTLPLTTEPYGFDTTVPLETTEDIGTPEPFTYW